MTEVCSTCRGTKWVTQPDGRREQCDCVAHQHLFAYLREFANKDLRIIPRDNYHAPMGKMVQKPGTFLFEAPSSDGKMTVFRSNLKRALSEEFASAWGRRQPQTWNIVSLQDVVQIRFEPKMALTEKQKILDIPRLLIIIVASWPPYAAKYFEVEQLLTDRTQRGLTTWLVAPSFGYFAEEGIVPSGYQIPTSFLHLIRSLRKSSALLVPDSLGVLGRKNKATVGINTHKGPGESSIDTAWIGLPKKVETRIAEVEKHVKHDGNRSDGQPSGK